LEGLERPGKTPGDRVKLAKDIPRGLKPTLILLPLWHD